MNNKDYIFNRDKIEEKLRMVKNSFYGYNTPISEYVCEKKGVLSDEKIEELADRLISVMVYNSEFYRYGMGGARRRCLQLYIYLVIRAYGDRIKTFGDILEVATDMMRSHSSLEDLILYETDWHPVDDEDEDEDYMEYKRMRYPRLGRGFFADLDNSYKLLAGHSIGDEMTEEELQQIWDRREKMSKFRGEEILKKYENLDFVDEYREDEEYRDFLYASADYEDIMAPREINENKAKVPKLLLTRKEIEAAREEELQRQKKWKDSFKDPVVFLEAYKEFRSLFFSTGLGYDGLEEAVILFLCYEGKSSLTDNEKYLQLHIQLDKAYRTARK